MSGECDKCGEHAVDCTCKDSFQKATRTATDWSDCPRCGATVELHTADSVRAEDEATEQKIANLGNDLARYQERVKELEARNDKARDVLEGKV